MLLASAAAQTLSGTVTNGTTNKPAVGDEVVLINLTTTMEVTANTKADSSGKLASTSPAGDWAAPHPRCTSGELLTIRSLRLWRHLPGRCKEVYDVTTKVPLTSP